MGRAVLLLILGAMVVAFTLAWALPNMAGPAFVQVRAVIAARVAPVGPTVMIGGGAAVRANAIEVSVETNNRYPLPVVVGTGRTAYQAAAYRRDVNGHLTRVWQMGVNDPALEEGSDSPVGGPSGNAAAVVPSGVSRHQITTSATSFGLTDASGVPLQPGVYYLRVWAYGIASPLVPIALDNAVDPLGPPADLPAPSN
jgi:hypothetical protein